ncbi:MAG: diphthine--ammonia ligase, partial [Candidatus Bathyarchaeota archaeon]|nr:diphthine--ammonia ligase [Candidatus Bathyarchaeota archaeon]
MRVAVSWSGGMESCLACHKVLAQGYDVTCLVTFVLDSWPSMCHPLPLMRLQSKAIEIPHLKVKVEEPYREGYKKAISRLKDTEGIEGIVTGDIYVVDSTHGRWMESVCEGLDIAVIMPLWGQDTYQILNEEVTEGFRAIFTCLKQPWFNEKWLGRELNKSCLKDLKTLIDRYGIDPCGEKGEYHTMVIDGPIF